MSNDSIPQKRQFLKSQTTLYKFLPNFVAYAKTDPYRSDPPRLCHSHHLCIVAQPQQHHSHFTRPFCPQIIQKNYQNLKQYKKSVISYGPTLVIKNVIDCSGPEEP